MSTQPVKLRFRVATVFIRRGSGIRSAAQIQVRPDGSKDWLPATFDGTQLNYWNRCTADRHCRWLNDPQGTEPEWGKDDSTEARLGAPERPGPGRCAVSVSEPSCVLRALRRWQAASRAYMHDCNVRLLGRGVTDPRRDRLSKRARRLFDEFLAMAEGQGGAKEGGR
jgi:hypothetical protein